MGALRLPGQDYNDDEREAETEVQPSRQHQREHRAADHGVGRSFEIGLETHTRILLVLLQANLKKLWPQFARNKEPVGGSIISNSI